MSTFDQLDEIEARAQAQAAAYERMLDIGEGIGGLALARPEMADAMQAWADSTDNEHADTVLALVEAVRESRAEPLAIGQWCSTCEFFEEDDSEDQHRCPSCGCPMAEHVQAEVRPVARGGASS